MPAPQSSPATPDPRDSTQLRTTTPQDLDDSHALPDSLDYHDPADAGFVQPPIADLVHQVAPPILSEPRVYDPVWNWCRHQGPHFGRRDAIEELARYVDPETGACTITHAQLAQGPRLSVDTIERQLRKARECGLVSWKAMRDRHGHVVAQRYVLAGVSTGWEVTVERGYQDVTSHSYRHRQELAASQLQIQQLMRQVEELGGVPVVGTTTSDPEPQPAVQGSQAFGSVRPWPDPQSAVQDSTPHNPQENGHFPPPSADDAELDDFCRLHFHLFRPGGRLRPKKGFNHIGGMRATLAADPQQYAQARADVEALEQEQAQEQEARASAETQLEARMAFQEERRQAREAVLAAGGQWDLDEWYREWVKRRRAEPSTFQMSATRENTTPRAHGKLTRKLLRARLRSFYGFHVAGLAILGSVGLANLVLLALVLDRLAS